ncbi:MAG: SLBB domain-containing protein [Planctomycetaceae bacterium]
MPSYRWSHLIAVLCGVGSAFTGTAASAFQFPPLSNDINTRPIHGPESWVGEGFRSSGSINQSPAEFGPSPGLWQRSPDGLPASGDRFPLMTPGPLPGGLSPNGFNSSGMFPPVNQPPFIANNPAFGGNGQSPFGADQSGQMPNGSNGSSQLMQSPPMPNAKRIQPKVSWALDSAQQPYVGLLGQVARPGVYEIAPKGARLGELIQEIGGLARDSSGQFRIIRNGRPGQMTSYAGAAQFELMAGDLVIADAKYSSSANSGQFGAAAKPAESNSVQIGFVNLIDRPVVLKLRREHSSVIEILTLMRQDEALASQIKLIAPPNQRSAGQARPDMPLPSDTVLIFPPNSVRAARLAPLPEPFAIKRDKEAATQPPAPRANISPDVTQSPRSQPSVRDWRDSQPLPQTALPVAAPVAQPNAVPTTEFVEAPLPPVEESSAERVGGVRSKPRSQDRIARDSHMVLAPPAELNETAPAPLPSVEEDQPDEPSLLSAHSPRRPIPSAKARFTDSNLVDAESSSTLDTDPDSDKTSTEKADSTWSIWPPLITAGAGLLALLGFSVMLRRRTQTAHAIPVAPPIAVRPQPARRDALEAIINDELPLTEERVPLTSPMQFHGRPQPAKTIRLDQEHALPRPHLGTGARGSRRQDSVNFPSRDRQEVTTSQGEPIDQDLGPVPHGRGSNQQTSQPPTASNSAAQTTQKFRIDRSGSTGTGTQILSTPSPATPPGPSVTGPLDRALSAVQKQTAPKQSHSTPDREEHGA